MDGCREGGDASDPAANHGGSKLFSVCSGAATASLKLGLATTLLVMFTYLMCCTLNERYSAHSSGSQNTGEL